MDTLRGTLSGYSLPGDDSGDYDRAEDDTGRELPPAAIGQDERRMQVRAYNFWASLLVDRSLPSIEDLDPHNLPDFGPHSVLLDFSCGIEDPAIVFLGDKLAAECGNGAPIHKLSDVPTRSLLSRITDHHLQIIANQAPIGFEAEFVNQRGMPVMYRGILLPFSSDDDTIDFIFGVINWKELADQQTTDELMLEIDQALVGMPEVARIEGPLTEWADGPVDAAARSGPAADSSDAPPTANDDDWPAVPVIGATVSETPGNDEDILDLAGYDADELGDEEAGDAAPASPALAAFPAATQPSEGIAAEIEPADMGLADWLAAARELALAAQGSEDRSRLSLYAAIGRAYDFSLAAAADPAGYAELAADAGLSAQDRAPMTPLVKLVFGATYDKTRLTEYAAALGHAHRIGLTRGALEAHLAAAPGGLKGVVAAERTLRREDAGQAAAPRITPRERLARKLRKLDHSPIADLSGDGAEFTLLVARRLPDGAVVLLGEVADDALLLERAARRLIG